MLKYSIAPRDRFALLKSLFGAMLVANGAMLRTGVRFLFGTHAKRQQLSCFCPQNLTQSRKAVMNIKTLVCAVLPFLLLPLLCSQSSAQVEFTLQNQGGLNMELTIEATGITTVAGSEALFVSDSQGEDFFPADGISGHFGFYSNDISLGGVQLRSLCFDSNGTQNTITFDFDGSIPAGTDLSELNGTYNSIICTVCEYTFEPGTYQVDFESGIDFGNVVVNALPPANLGDVNGDGAVNFLDVSPFIAVLSFGLYRQSADINEDGVVSFLDIGPFIELLSRQ